MIGVSQGSYWNHRRIWVQKGEGNEMLLPVIQIKTGSH